MKVRQETRRLLEPTRGKRGRGKRNCSLTVRIRNKDNHYLRLLSYICTWGKVREILFNTSPLCIDWMHPPHLVYTADYATYAQILT